MTTTIRVTTKTMMAMAEAKQTTSQQGRRLSDGSNGGNIGGNGSGESDGGKSDSDGADGGGGKSY